MIKLKEDAVKFTWYHVAIIILLGVGLMSLPLYKLFDLCVTDKINARLISAIVLRFFFGAIAVYFLIKYGFKGVLTSKPTKKSFLIVIPALLVCVNNAPLIAMFSGNIEYTQSAIRVVLYFVYCLSIGFYEEIIFRGLIFPLCYIKTAKYKHGVFWAIVVSSALFGLSHLMNLINGQGVVETLLQVGYTFLIGSMCSICILKMRSIYVGIILHFIYDLGGLMNGIVAKFNQWDTATIIITAVLGVIVGVYMLYLALKLRKEEMEDIYSPNGIGNALITDEQVEK